ncbi:MAG: hypothetical protein V4490_00900, partial [Pseudomonadota bacterium]
RMYAYVFRNDSPLAELKGCFTKVIFNGKNVTSSFFECQATGVKIEKFEKGEKMHRSSGVYRVSNAGPTKRLPCTDETILIYNDIHATDGLINRLAPLIEMPTNILGKQYEKVYLVTLSNLAEWQQWKQDEQFDAPLVSLSTLPRLKISQIYPRDPYSSSNKPVNVKHLSKVFRYEYEKVDRGNSRRFRYLTVASDYWQPAEIDLDEDEGVYVGLYKFEPILKSSPISGGKRTIEYYKQWFGELGLEFPEVIGLKPKSNGTIPEPPNMVHLEDYVVTEIKAKIAQLNKNAEIIERQAALGKSVSFVTDFAQEAAEK